MRAVTLARAITSLTMRTTSTAASRRCHQLKNCLGDCTRCIRNRFHASCGINTTQLIRRPCRIPPLHPTKVGRTGRVSMALRSLVMTAALLSGFGAAQAADLPQRAPAPYRAPAVVAPVPVYNWTGFYIGANGGYGWAGASASSGGMTVDGGDLKGPFAGGQVGFNYQTGMFVFGVEVRRPVGQHQGILRRVRPDTSPTRSTTSSPRAVALASPRKTSCSTAPAATRMSARRAK